MLLYMASFSCANKIKSKSEITELWLIFNNTEKGNRHIFKASSGVNMRFLDRLLYTASYFVSDHTGKL